MSDIAKKIITTSDVPGVVPSENPCFFGPVLITQKGAAFCWRFEDITITGVRESMKASHQFWNFEGIELQQLSVSGEDSYAFVPFKAIQNVGLKYEVLIEKGELKTGRAAGILKDVRVTLEIDGEGARLVFSEEPSPNVHTWLSRRGMTVEDVNERWVATLNVQGRDYLMVK